MSVCVSFSAELIPSRPSRRSTILSHLKQGKIVLCDRYAFSGIAFSVAKGLPSEHSEQPSSDHPPIDLSWARAPDASLPSPDLTLFLDISPEAARSRGGYGDERYEKEDMQRRVRSVFGEIGQEISGGNGTENAINRRWIIVDAGREMSTVTEQMWRHVQSLLDGLDAPINRLWE